MNAYRCPECGDVRWSFLAGAESNESPSCEICGETMVAERRRPGSPARTSRERREGEHPAAAAPPSA